MNKNDLSQDKRRPSDIFAHSQADQTEGDKFMQDTSQASGLFAKKRDDKAFLKSYLFKQQLQNALGRRVDDSISQNSRSAFQPVGDRSAGIDKAEDFCFSLNKTTTPRPQQQAFSKMATENLLEKRDEAVADNTENQIENEELS